MRRSGAMWCVHSPGAGGQEVKDEITPGQIADTR